VKSLLQIQKGDEQVKLNGRTVSIVVVVIAIVVVGIFLLKDYYREEDVFALPSTDLLSKTIDGITVRVLGISEEYWTDEYAAQVVNLHTFPSTSSGVRIWTDVKAPDHINCIPRSAKLQTAEGIVAKTVSDPSGKWVFFPDVKLTQVKSLTWEQEIPVYTYVVVNNLPVSSGTHFSFDVLVDDQQTEAEVTLKKNQVLWDRSVDEISVTVGVPVSGESISVPSGPSYVVGNDGKEYKVRKFGFRSRVEDDVHFFSVVLSVDSLPDTVESISYAYEIRTGSEQKWTFYFDLQSK